MNTISVINGYSLNWKLGLEEYKYGFIFYKASKSANRDCDLYRLYIGRTFSFYNLEASILHNPYKLDYEKDRKDVIDKFINRFNKRMEKKGAFRTLIRVLVKLMLLGADIELACFCKPKDCHGDHIASQVSYYYIQCYKLLQTKLGNASHIGLAQLHQLIDEILTKYIDEPIDY